MRPHPPLIPHFQLANESSLITTSSNHYHHHNLLTSSINNNNNNNNYEQQNIIPKRFMYKTLVKSLGSDDYGKHWGADDDLTILNVIENIFKSKQLHHKLKTTKSNESIESSLSSSSNKNIQLLVQELQESQQLNVKLKQICFNLENQLQTEQKWNQKLELYIRKHFASSSTLLVTNKENKDLAINISLIDELESNV
jgi:hypothetical protein